jgi:antitoxin YefM
MAVTASEARRCVLMSRDDYDALEETAHLQRAPANARRLLESLEQVMSGARAEHDLTR